jgi:hypothetical protein
LTDIVLPEVPALPQKARFFREGGRDLVELSTIGSKDTVVRKVQPQHMAQFRSDWNAYCDGQPPQRRSGTPLTDLPSLNKDKAEVYVAHNVHTLEELAELSDAQCQGLGHGTLTDREQARKLMEQRRFAAKEHARKVVSDAAAGIGPAPAENYASRSELAEVKDLLAALSKNVATLAERMRAKAPGRPKKRTIGASRDGAVVPAERSESRDP